MPVNRELITEKREIIMKHFEKYDKVIASKEMSAGNESVGNMWIETKSFDKTTPIRDIIEWAKNCGGRLIITIDESNANNDVDLNF